MGSLLSAFVLSLTVITVVAIGILAAFGVVIFILQSLAPKDEPTNRQKSVVVPQAHAAHAGGD